MRFLTRVFEREGDEASSILRRPDEEAVRGRERTRLALEGDRPELLAPPQVPSDKGRGAIPRDEHVPRERAGGVWTDEQRRSGWGWVVRLCRPQGGGGGARATNDRAAEEGRHRAEAREPRAERANVTAQLTVL